MILLGCLFCALIAASIFNTVLLVWLGLMVLLTADRRRWGIWLAGCGLLGGGFVFLSHSAVLIEGAAQISTELNAWWPLGWGTLIFTPFAWYVAMLWYSGFWEDPASNLSHRHRPLFWTSAAFTLVLTTLLLLARPLPFTVAPSGLSLDLSARPAVSGIPLLVILYPLFILLCIAFSLDALGRPGPTYRAMGGLARRRARPWLIAASLMLLGVSLLLVGVLLWLVTGGRYSLTIAVDRLTIDLMAVDLLISVLAAAAVVLVGQAVVAYEVFTGRSLPRRGLRRQFHSAVVLALGAGLFVSVSYLLGLPPTYIFLLAALLVAVVYALASWRAFADRDHDIARLRPFVTSEHVYDSLLSPDSQAPPQVGAERSFAGLCRDVLGAERAYLVPTSPLSSLMAAPLAYPDEPPPDLHLDRLIDTPPTPEVMTLAVEPAAAGGAAWAVPLWGARGLMGYLLLGNKTDGGLYTQEQIEIARSTGERLLDTIAGATLAQRLMALQRQRFIEMQVIDRQSRRTIHDDILPELHAVMLALRGQSLDRTDLDRAVDQLAGVHQQLSGLLREMPSGLDSQVSELGLAAALRKAVETEFRGDFDAISWQIEPEAERRARALTRPAADVLFYAAKEAVRNAARHARGGDSERPLHLTVSLRSDDGLELRVADDGVGPTSRESLSSPEGRGLMLHTTMLAVIGGSLVSERGPDGGTTVTLLLPEGSLPGGEPDTPPGPFTPPEERSPSAPAA